MHVLHLSHELDTVETFTDIRFDKCHVAVLGYQSTLGVLDRCVFWRYALHAT